MSTNYKDLKQKGFILFKIKKQSSILYESLNCFINL